MKRTITPKAFEELKERLQVEINRLNTRNNELQEKLDNNKKEAKKLLGEARIEVNGLKDKISSLNRETEIERKTYKLETKILRPKTYLLCLRRNEWFGFDYYWWVC